MQKCQRSYPQVLEGVIKDVFNSCSKRLGKRHKVLYPFLHCTFLNQIISLLIRYILSFWSSLNKILSNLL